MKQARFFYLHEKCNKGKIQRLESLHAEYVKYVNFCIDELIQARIFNIPRQHYQKFFTKSTALTSQIQKSAREAAASLFLSWAKSIYARKLKKHITMMRRDGKLSEEEAKHLYTVGKYSVNTPYGSVTQDNIDAYKSLLFDKELAGEFPKATARLPITFTEMTCELNTPDAQEFEFGIKISTLTRSKTMWLPLKGNPFITKPEEVSKTVQARKDKRGRWRFEVIEKEEFHILEVPAEANRIGVDVGLNVIAATSDGRVYGSEAKPVFNKKYEKILKVRAERQRQGLPRNSPRLDRLEDNLSGFIKTVTGTIANKLVRIHSGSIFVIEELDLRGCKGQKRFAYKALAKSLESKARVIKVNPAYTSQMCPSCGYIHSGNRSGIKFLCRACGKKSHADVVGATNLLGRSEMKQISSTDHPKVVRDCLGRLYRERRRRTWDRPQEVRSNAPPPLGRRFGFSRNTEPAP